MIRSSHRWEYFRPSRTSISRDSDRTLRLVALRTAPRLALTTGLVERNINESSACLWHASNDPPDARALGGVPAAHHHRLRLHGAWLREDRQRPGIFRRHIARS